MNKTNSENSLLKLINLIEKHYMIIWPILSAIVLCIINLINHYVLIGYCDYYQLPPIIKFDNVSWWLGILASVFIAGTLLLLMLVIKRNYHIENKNFIMLGNIFLLFDAASIICFVIYAGFFFSNITFEILVNLLCIIIYAILLIVSVYIGSKKVTCWILTVGLFNFVRYWWSFNHQVVGFNILVQIVILVLFLGIVISIHIEKRSSLQKDPMPLKKENIIYTGVLFVLYLAIILYCLIIIGKGSIIDSGYNVAKEHTNYIIAENKITGERFVTFYDPSNKLIALKVNENNNETIICDKTYMYIKEENFVFEVVNKKLIMERK